MKKFVLKYSFFFLFTFLMLNTIFAQLQLPAPSPKASVTQTAGLTDITIEYSSPGVKGRTIWGDLVPYDSLWRAGANQATKITFSKAVTIEGTSVPAGSYSLFIIPTKADWTIILNKNSTASTDDYKQDQDVVRINSKQQAIPLRERLAYSISDFTDESAAVNMEWEKARVSFLVKLDTEKQAMTNINNVLNGTWRTYTNAARYMLDNKKDLDMGLKWVDQSLALSDQWYSHWIKAQLLAEKKMTKEAYASALKAKELGDKSENFFYKKEVEKAIADWKPKK